MKIYISAETYPTPKDPSTAFVSVLCRELAAQGHEITVIAPQSIVLCLRNRLRLAPRHYCDKIHVNGEERLINVYRPYTLFHGFGRAARLTKIGHEFAVRRTARKLPPPDICYAHFWTSAFSILKYSKQNSIPLFVASGEDRIFFQNFLSTNELKDLRDYTSGVICVSSKNLEESIACGFTTRDKCGVFPNAVDSNIFFHRNRKEIRKQLGFPEDAFIVAFTGRFYRRKGVDRLSAAITKLNNENINSVFIGTTNPGEDLRPNCKGILFMGTLPHDEVALYLCASDVFVLPSLAEGCSNSIVEALSCGLPVISSDLPFNYDILDKKNSILIDPNNEDEIAEAINTLYNDHILCQRMSDCALDSAKKLKIDIRAQRIIEFIKSKINK